MGVIIKAAIAGVLGLLALLFSLFLSVRIGRALIRDLRQLRLEAHEASGVRLPSVMRRLSAGEQVDVETEVPRLEYDKNEIGEVGQALNTLQRAAVEAAVKQAELRAGVSEVFVNLARRSQVLLHKQLTLLDTMERRTEDTDELADLFRLDHLTTRMRRHAEGLVILSGAAPSRQWRRPVQLMDVVRAAVAEVEDYERIEVRRLPRVAVTGPAVADITHLVAELLENATVFSPPHTAVQVLGERVANGFTLEIHDRGLGMAADALLDANLRLAETPEFELSDTDRLGLFVVSRLAQRQNVRVSLQPSPYGGTTAVVFIPDALLTDDVPDTNGIGFRLDRPTPSKEAEREEARRSALSHVPVRVPGLPASLLDGPVELEAPVDLDALSDFPDGLDDEDSERGGIFRSRRTLASVEDETTGPIGEQRRSPTSMADRPRPTRTRLTPRSRCPAAAAHPSWSARTGVRSPSSAPGGRSPTRSLRQARAVRSRTASLRCLPAAVRTADRADGPGAPDRTGDRPTLRPPPGTAVVNRRSPAALPRRARRPAIASSGPEDPAQSRTAARRDDRIRRRGALPRRVRQANLAPQLRQGPAPRAEDTLPSPPNGTPTRSAAAWPRSSAAGSAAARRTPRATTPTAAQHHKERLRGTVDDRTEGDRPHRDHQAGELNWLLDDLVDRVASIRKALVLSGDGLPTGVSGDLTREDSEHLAAVASGFHSLAKGVGRHFEAGNVRQTVVELDDAFLFVTAAGDGSCLAVLSDADSDVGLVAYEMTLLVKRVGVHLGSAPRTDLPSGG